MSIPSRARRPTAAAIVRRACAVALLGGSWPAQAQLAPAAEGGAALETVIVTARLRPEDAQAVPVSMSIVDAALIDRSYSNNVQQLSQLLPSVNYSSPNPRNTALTIRGLGSSVVAIAQANDGLEPGVGFYVDQVYHGRPATAAFDFADLERVEVLRGPQGTLFGKNTTAGAVNITSKAPSFEAESSAEVSGGNYGYYQAKATATGGLYGDALAGRLSAGITGRNGVIENVRTHGDHNDVHNYEARGQLLWQPGSALRVRLIADYSSFDSNCCTQVYVTVGQSLKPAARQYPALAAGLGYAPPSLDPYDRLTDIDAALRVATAEGGLAAIADWSLGGATLTSVSAWRFWNWDAANDRDYTGLSIQTLQHIPSRQDQWSQELRLASNGTRQVDYVAGLYWFSQTVLGEPITQYGPLATYWLLGPPATYPGSLLDGYGTDGHTRFHSDSYAAFGEATWHATDKLSLTAGGRYTQEEKHGRYAAVVYGGLATTNPTLLKAQLSILRPQAYQASDSNGSPSGRANLAYQWTPEVMTYLSYALTSKSGGLNMSGLPLNAANQPALATAVIKPEHNATLEAGLKSQLLGRRLLVNADLYKTVVRDFQTNVVDNGPGALRGYLANIERVEVKGAELDAGLRLGAGLTARAAAAWTDARYVSYRNGPCPLELIAAATTVCDLSGRPLSGTPHTAFSAGAEYARPTTAGLRPAELFVRVDAVWRGDQYGDPSDSRYTLIRGYSVLNASAGLRVARAWEASVWARNLLNRNYLQNVTVQAGNPGLVVGTPGDPATYGVTLRARF
ncbi:MAG: TonB-dependent receptor [Proteobacteria bacterium]|nr:TonB-dependent receptor [Pseudomonadota bacterium]